MERFNLNKINTVYESQRTTLCLDPRYTCSFKKHLDGTSQRISKLLPKTLPDDCMWNFLFRIVPKKKIMAPTS
jgi:hypothetical protein